VSEALVVSGLSIERLDGANIVEDVSFSLSQGELLGLVGESGCGKTTLSLGLLGYTNPGLRIRSGSVRLGTREDLVGRSDRELRRVRGRRISYVAQDPSVALNPALRVEAQIRQVQRSHDLDDGHSVKSLLDTVRLPADQPFRRRFPHELSGGQQQRLAIAIALAARPDVLVLDEPTTALDVVTQEELLGEIQRLRRELRLGVVYVTHDLAVVAGVADRIAVMYAGRVIELGSTAQLLTHPRHPYSRGLLTSIPDVETPRQLRGLPGVAVAAWESPGGCAFAPRCPQANEQCRSALPRLEPVATGHEVRCFHWRDTPAGVGLQRRELAADDSDGRDVLEVQELRASYAGAAVLAVSDVSFTVMPGQCVALVGESGSGKTTIARCAVGLHKPDSGRILLRGQPLPYRARERTVEQRRSVQIVFQNPYDSLNPRRTVAEALARPLRLFEIVTRSEVKSEVERLIDLVRLPARLATRFPHELSGGERQRVAIARAIAARPSVLVCDEITSALDVSVQAVVLEVLGDLRRALDLSLLLITHDLGVVASVADEVVVLEKGRLRERGAIGAILSSPKDPYTRRLLDAAPTLADPRPDETRDGVDLPHTNHPASDALPPPSSALGSCGDRSSPVVRADADDGVQARKGSSSLERQ
jgi:peptide/nickel transport system ATP-binding protein